MNVAVALQALCFESDHGGPYPLDLVEDAVAVLVLASFTASSAADPDVARLVARFIARARAAIETTPVPRAATLARYVDGRFPDALVAALVQIVANAPGDARPGAVAEFARFVAGDATLPVADAPPRADAA